MKVYSIGREVGCDIVINDTTNVVSRRHAILNVTSSGKMTIVDQSQNGTYVNGIRISQNVPVPVTRKDNISFAHIARLDWNLVPNTGAALMRYVLLGLAALLFIIGGVWGCHEWNSSQKTDTPVVTVDSNAIKQNEEELKKEEARKQDSIKKHIEDSIKNMRAKQAPKAEHKKAEPKKAETKKTTPKKAETKKSAPKQETKKTETTRFH